MNKGLYKKYEISEGGNPVKGNYFVLRPDADIHAVHAIRAYAESCREDNPELATDLLMWASNVLTAALQEKASADTATCAECGEEQDVRSWLKSGPICLKCFDELTN